MWLTILEVLHQLSIKSLVEKVKLTQVPVTGFQTQKIDQVSWGYAILLPNV